MIIFLKNKYTLVVDDFYFKCCVGKNGVTTQKVEGDKKTPTGTFKIEHLYFRKDRINLPKLTLKCIKITKKMGWCDDSKSKKYNRLIKYPFAFSSEKLFRKDNVYDIILVLNYNMNPTKKYKGSAIFIHIAKKKYDATEGCVAIKKVNLLKLIKSLKKNTKIKIL